MVENWRIHVERYWWFSATILCAITVSFWLQSYNWWSVLLTGMEQKVRLHLPTITIHVWPATEKYPFYTSSTHHVRWMDVRPNGHRSWLINFWLKMIRIWSKVAPEPTSKCHAGWSQLIRGTWENLKQACKSRCNLRVSAVWLGANRFAVDEKQNGCQWCQTLQTADEAWTAKALELLDRHESR